MKLVLVQGLKVAALGLGLGLAGALVLTKLMSSILTFVSVPVLLALVSVVACWIPARRATRVDPIEVLRAE